MKSAIRFVMLILCVAMLAARVSPANAAMPKDHIVVMISVDGLAGYYLDDPKAEMPNIRALAAAGARAASMKAVAPTVTWPNHTTLVTGDFPARHGVVGNNYFDRSTGKSVQLIQDPVLDEGVIVHVPTIYDLAQANGLLTAAVRWPATRNAKGIDLCIPELVVIDQLKKIMTPSVLEMCEKDNINFYGTEPEDPTHVDQNTIDPHVVPAFLAILREKHPNFAMLHVIAVDHTEHAKGPKSPEAYAAIKGADAQVGEVWEELKKDYADKATLVVVSDHGFSPIEHAVLPNVILRKAGLLEVKGIRVSKGDVHVVVQGGAAMIYILDDKNRDAIAAKVEKAFTGVDGIEKVVTTEHLNEYGIGTPTQDPHAPDIVLFANEGYIFGDTAAGSLSFVEKPERSGSHGHDPNLPDLHATFVAWGVGIQLGVNLGEINNTDVAPTLASLMQIDMPNVDGKPLTAALTK